MTIRYGQYSYRFFMSWSKIDFLTSAGEIFLLKMTRNSEDETQKFLYVHVDLNMKKISEE